MNTINNEILFKEVGWWKAVSTESKNLGYSIRTSRGWHTGLFWPNDDCSIGEVIMYESEQQPAVRTGVFFPYNDQGLLQAVRYCFLRRQEESPKKKWMIPIKRIMFRLINFRLWKRT